MGKKSKMSKKINNFLGMPENECEEISPIKKPLMEINSHIQESSEGRQTFANDGRLNTQEKMSKILGISDSVVDVKAQTKKKGNVIPEEDPNQNRKENVRPEDDKEETTKEKIVEQNLKGKNEQKESFFPENMKANNLEEKVSKDILYEEKTTSTTSVFRNTAQTTVNIHSQDLYQVKSRENDNMMKDERSKSVEKSVTVHSTNDVMKISQHQMNTETIGIQQKMNLIFGENVEKEFIQTMNNNSKKKFSQLIEDQFNLAQKKLCKLKEVTDHLNTIHVQEVGEANNQMNHQQEESRDDASSLRGTTHSKTSKDNDKLKAISKTRRYVSELNHIFLSLKQSFDQSKKSNEVNTEKNVSQKKKKPSNPKPLKTEQVKPPIEPEKLPQQCVFAKEQIVEEVDEKTHPTIPYKAAETLLPIMPSDKTYQEDNHNVTKNIPLDKSSQEDTYFIPKKFSSHKTTQESENVKTTTIEEIETKPSICTPVPVATFKPTTDDTISALIKRLQRNL